MHQVAVVNVLDHARRAERARCVGVLLAEQGRQLLARNFEVSQVLDRIITDIEQPQRGEP